MNAYRAGGAKLGIAVLPQAAIILWKHRAELALTPSRRRRERPSP